MHVKYTSNYKYNSSNKPNTMQIRYKYNTNTMQKQCKYNTNTVQVQYKTHPSTELGCHTVSINNIYLGRTCSPRVQMPLPYPLTRRSYCEGLASSYVQMDTWSEQASTNKGNTGTRKTDSYMNNICHGRQCSYRFRIYLCV